MSRVLLVLLLALMAVGACTSAPPSDGGLGAGGDWSYAKGPHGENCLFYQSGFGDGHIVTMSCDSVKP